VSIRRRLAVFAGSAALHVAAAAGILTLAAELRQPQPLFIDMTGGGRAGDLGAASSQTPPPRRAARAAGSGREAWRADPPALPPALPPSRPPEPLSRVEAPPVPEPAGAPSRESVPEGGAHASPTPAAGEGGGAPGVASDAPGREGQPGSGATGTLLALVGPGTDRGEPPAEFGPYLARFRQRIQEFLVYPLAARRRGLSGRVEVEVLLEPTGRVRGVTIVTSSSHHALDEAALDAVRQMPPLAMPEHLPRRALRVRLPVIFELR
jgi:periplasmic protein TonB